MTNIQLKDIDLEEDTGEYQYLGTPTSCPLKENEFPADYVLVFATTSRENPTVDVVNEQYSCPAFVQILLGFDGRHQNEPKVVLRTRKCFTKEQLMSASNDMLEVMKNALEEEYEEFIGHRNATTQAKFSELIAKSIARRLQLTCGLETKMFYGLDEKEIFVLIQADMTDLQVEATRMKYKLQTSLEPFHEAHDARNDVLRTQIGDELEASKLYLYTRRKNQAQSMDRPQLDPLLMAEDGIYHPKMYAALKTWSHSPVADLPSTRQPEELPELSLWSRLKNSLLFISRDQMTYFSPYVNYTMEPKFQPYFRYYPETFQGENEATLFRQVDRIRLVYSIITRHLGIDALLSTEFLSAHFPLHDPATIKHLTHKWALNFRMYQQPIHILRNYFGEKIALYFAWLEFYAKMLIFPAIVGIPMYFIDQFDEQGQAPYFLMAYGVLVIVWSALFTELWKRKNAFYNTLWGMDEKAADLSTSPRPEFIGTERKNPITDQPQIYYASLTQRRRRIGMGILVVIFMILIVIIALGGFFLWKHHIAGSPNAVEYGYGISALNAVQIMVLNYIYQMIATWLNDYENHRTEVEYENFLVSKVFLFQFVNSFASFFYIAFIKQDIEGACIASEASHSTSGACFNELQVQLLILFLMQIAVNNLTEIVLPYAMMKFQLFRSSKATTRPSNGQSQRKRLTPAEYQAKLLPYEDETSFYDYNELVIQYGFVTLFVVAFPLTPLLALLNNIVEVHVDGFKLVSGHRRPFPRKVNSIGTWFYFLRIMSNIAIITNCALILFTSSLFRSIEDQSTKLIIFLVVEHAAISLKFLIDHLIKQKPTQLDLLTKRFQHIDDVVFKGLNPSQDADQYSEIPEQLNLIIESHQQWIH